LRFDMLLIVIFVLTISCIFVNGTHPYRRPKGKGGLHRLGILAAKHFGGLVTFWAANSGVYIVTMWF